MIVPGNLVRKKWPHDSKQLHLVVAALDFAHDPGSSIRAGRYVFLFPQLRWDEEATFERWDR